MTKLNGGKAANLIGGRVRELRLTQGISQQQLANLLAEREIYLSQKTISLIERQRRTVLDVEMRGLAEALGVKPSELLEKEYLPESK